MRWPVSLVLCLVACRVESIPWMLTRGDHVEGAYPAGFVYDERALAMASRRRWSPADALAPPVIPDAWSAVRGSEGNHGHTIPIGVLAGDGMWWFALEVHTQFHHTRARRYLGIFALDRATGLRTEVAMFEVDYEGDLALRWGIVDRDLVATYRARRGRARELRVQPQWLLGPGTIEWDATAPLPPPPPSE